MPKPHRTTVIASLAAVALSLIASVVTVAHGATAKSSDTIAAVATAAKAGVARMQPVQLALTDAQNVMNRMSTDSVFQKAVLGFANKNDVAGLTSFIQKIAPNSTVSVTELKDFHLYLGFTVKGHHVGLCVSNDTSCVGLSATLEIT
jgi:hypothetical protein